jgi:hypothetical protein
VDPAELGFTWRIRPGSVDAVFLLDGRHEGPTQVAVCPTHLAVKLVMAQSTPPRGGQGPWVGDVSAVVGRARCHTLILGDLDSAVDVLRECLDASVPAAQPV